MPSIDIFERWRLFEETNSNAIKESLEKHYAIRKHLNYAV